MIRWLKILPPLAASLALAACATVSTPTTQSCTVKDMALVKPHYKPTDVDMVQLVSTPQSDYKEIGEVYVNRYNVWGIKRQFGVISNIMRNKAAEIGGNAVTHVQLNHKFATGEIIRYTA